MAIRVDDKMTFLHLPKTGGTSFTQWIKNNFENKFIHSGDTHDTYDQLPDSWRNNIYCVIRNPYDRTVTLYNYAKKVFSNPNILNHREFNKYFKPQIDELNKGFEHYILNMKDVHLYKRVEDKTRGVSAWNKKTLLRFLPKDLTKVNILRYENLNEDFKKVQDFLNCQKPLPRENVSRPINDDYRRWYTSEKLKEEVYNVFKEEIETFGYEF